MNIIWNLKEILNNQGIENASQLQKALEECLRIGISRQSLHKLINNTPSYLRLETIQQICNLLNISSSELFIIRPEEDLKITQEIIKLYDKKPIDSLLQSNPLDFLK